MKIKFFIQLFIILVYRLAAFAQISGDTLNSNSQYVIQKFDGDIYVGRIIYKDPRMLQLRVKKNADIFIKRNDIELIREINKKELSALSKYTPNDVFASKYFITSNVLPVNVLENCSQLNWYGPDMNLTILKNLCFNVVTTWAAVPIISSVRYSVPLSEKANFGIGTLMGWGSWAYMDCTGLFPYGAFSFGSRKSNITFSGGYGTLSIYGVNEQRPICSISGITKSGKRTSLVFDSYALPSFSKGSTSYAIVIPGIRIQTEYKSAFQFGFGGLFLNWSLEPIVIPFLQWFRHI